MNRKIRERRKELKTTWIGLRESANRTNSIEKGVNLRILEDKIYRLWKFYDGIIKAFDKIGGITYEQ